VSGTQEGLDGGEPARAPSAGPAEVSSFLGGTSSLLKRSPIPASPVRRNASANSGDRFEAYFGAGTGSDSIGTGGPGAIVAPGGSCSGAIGAPKIGPLGWAGAAGVPVASGGW